MPNALPLRDAAAALGVGQATLRRWLRAGAPQARRGARGRGRAALVDPAAVAAWHRASGTQDALRAIAGEVPGLLADAVDDYFRGVVGPHKRPCAGELAGAWYVVTVAVLDRIRRECPDVPEVEAVPEPIERLRKIARQ
jgi:hypothetical protein